MYKTKKYFFVTAILLTILSFSGCDNPKAESIRRTGLEEVGLDIYKGVLEFKKDTNFVFENEFYFKVKHAKYKKGRFYSANDILKLESISQKDLLEMAKDLDDNLKETPKEIIFYDLDELNMKNYEKNIFKQVIARF